MNALTTIRSAPGLESYLERLELRLEQAVASHPGLVGEAGGEILAAGGKRLRPALVFLATPPHLRSTERTAAAGAAVELIHMATLVHDDLIDSAELRRGKPTVWAAYGEEAAKAAGDYLYYYRQVRGLEYTALALANVYGPRQDPHGEAGVVAIFCGRLLDGERPTVYGDGLQTRDYVYVGDVVRAFLAAATGPAGETMNVGCGVEVSVLDVLAGLGYEEDPEFAPARPGELQRSALDVAKAARVLGWRAEVELAEGLGVTRESVVAARQAPDGRPPGAFSLV